MRGWPLLSRFSLLFVALACFSCSLVCGGSESVPASHRLSSDTADGLPNDLERPADSGLGTNGLWGVFARDLSTGQVLLQRNENSLFVPASNMKLFTTAVALVLLGPDFRYTTGLYSPTLVQNGIIPGDVYLRGSGDPTISERFQGRSTAVFEGWADQLKQQGVREIRGDIVGDDRLFDDLDLGEGWAWDDELFCYSARIGAISFNDNCIDVTLTPAGRPEEPALLVVTPITAYAMVRNRVITSPDDEVTHLETRRPAGSSMVTLSGRLNAASPPRHIRFSVMNPTLYAVTVLKEVLQGKGIRVLGEALDIDDSEKTPDYPSLKTLVSYRSPPLSDIIEQINKRSQNLYAELLFRTIGVVYKGEGSADKSVQVMKQSLETMGIRGDSLAIHDGSGLSRLNLASPAQIVHLLEFMAKHPYFPYFLRSLPVAGIDGTLARSVNNTGADGKVRAKTGTLSHMHALSGYLENRNGGWIAFSILNNNSLDSAPQIRSMQDAVCQRLLSLGEKRR